MRCDSPYRDLESLKRGEILHVSTGISVSKAQLLDIIKAYKIIDVGETHDNIYDHEVELEIIKGLDGLLPGKLSLGMEMFDHTSQPALDEWMKGDLTEEDLKRIFSLTWSERDFPYYKKILEYARKEGIPIIGLNASDEERKELMELSGKSFRLASNQ